MRRVRLAGAPELLRSHRSSRGRVVLPGLRRRHQAGRRPRPRRGHVFSVPGTRRHPYPRAAPEPVEHRVGRRRHARAPVLRREPSRGSGDPVHHVCARRRHDAREELAHGAHVRPVRSPGRSGAVLDEELLPGFPSPVRARRRARAHLPRSRGQPLTGGVLLRRALRARVRGSPTQGCRGDGCHRLRRRVGRWPTRRAQRRHLSRRVQAEPRRRDG